MKSKIFLIAVLVMVLMYMTVGFVPMAYAQDEAEIPEAPVTFGWIIIAWLIYSFAGFFASGESFNGIKFARTFLVTIIVAFTALALRIPPANVVTQYGAIIDQLATVVMNASPGVMLILLSEKLLKIVNNFKAKWEKAKEVAHTGLGSPSPKPTV